MSYKANGEYVEKKSKIEGFQNNLLVENFEGNKICITNEVGEKICMDYNFFYMAKKLIETSIPNDQNLNHMSKKDINNIISDVEMRSNIDEIEEEQDPLINYEVISKTEE